VGNACKVGVYDLKVSWKFKNGSSRFRWGLGIGHGIIQVYEQLNKFKDFGSF
jgi:hypothetical protein